MPQFNYVAVNKTGVRVKGMINAPNEAEVRVVLRTQQLRPVRINKAGAFEIDLAKLVSSGSAASEIEVILFTRQLSILLSSGVPLVQGLDVIAAQIKNGPFKNLLLAMKEKISAGSFLWEAMKPYKDAFPDIYVSMIRAGESAGALDTILKRLLKYLEDAYRLKKLVKGAMIYPIAVVIVGFFVVAGMMIFVIPKFEDLLKSGGQELPVPTKLVLDFSHFFQHNIHFIVAAGLATWFFSRHYARTPEGKRFFNHYSLRMPLFGPLFLKVALSRFSRTLQTMLSSGISLLDALDISREAIGNETVADSVRRMKLEVEQGKTLAGIMAKLPIFPGMVVQMVTVGENTGNLDKMLDKVAELYEEEVQIMVSSLTKLLEPIILVVLGGMVGGLMIAMYLPIFKLAGGV